MKLLLCLFVLLSTITFSAPRPGPSEAIDIKHYRFRIELNDSTDVIGGTAEVSFVCRKAFAEFELDLIGKNVEGKGMQVTRVTHKNTPLKFRHQDDLVRVALNGSTGEYITVVITYSGIPRDGLIISKNKFGDRTFFADNWPDRGRHWLPVIDHPADKAAVEFTVIAPLHYAVVSNGLRVQESYLNPKQKLTTYHETAEVSTKVMVIGVARFAVERSGTVNNIPVESWVYPQNRTEGFNDYALAVKVLDFFNSHIGPYSYGKLANVQSKTTFGGLENASAIFYFENSVTGKAAHEMLIAHEVAHQWFGNSATEKEWAHVWLSEGLATYFAMLYAEFTHGDDRRRMEMTTDRTQVVAFAKNELTPVVNTHTEDPMKLLNANSYQKGSWVMHMLRREVGDRDFWAGIRSYYKKFQNSTALTADLQKCMEMASGKDLAPFFNQWLFKSGHPVLEGSWSYDQTSKKLQLSVTQTQKSGVFNFPLEVGIYTESNEFPQVEKVYITKDQQQLTISLPSKPFKIVLDPHVNLLFEGKLRN